MKISAESPSLYKPSPRVMTLGCSLTMRTSCAGQGEKKAVNEVSLVRKTVRGLSELPSFQCEKWKPVLGVAEMVW